jgi:hypothetical protein
MGLAKASQTFSGDMEKEEEGEEEEQEESKHYYNSIKMLEKD